jgi:ubiquinone/menaquinone biosynthesis C-methylase UbiE
MALASPRSYLKRLLPPRYVEAYRVGRRVVEGQPAWPPANLYEQLYEIHSLASSDADAVGHGPFDTIGKAELAVLRREGLQPTHTLVDFGCGTGRLAVHAIPALPDGRYIGIDISKEMLRRLDERLKTCASSGTCRVSLMHQTTDVFQVADSTADMLCAFSVFTHMEHEDTYRYLRSARRIVRPGGRVVFSCLSLDTPLARSVFLDSSSADLQARWRNTRNVTTTHDMMREISELAGWRLVRWYRGDDKNVLLPGSDVPLAFGQSIGVLARTEASQSHFGM